MPRFGRLDPARLAQRLPIAGKLADEPWESPAQVLHFAYELDPVVAVELLPPALHPSIPTYATLVLREHASSPVGPFRMAELRVMGRAGIHPGGLVIGAIADRADAVTLLRESYGSPARLGEVRIERRHHETSGSVRAEGQTLLEIGLERAEPIGATDFTYAVSFHLALVEGSPWLVQVEPVYTPQSAERGSARLRVFDAAGFGDGLGDARVKLTDPLPGTYMAGSVELRRVRWLMDPSRPAVAGARRR